MHVFQPMKKPSNPFEVLVSLLQPSIATYSTKRLTANIGGECRREIIWSLEIWNKRKPWKLTRKIMVTKIPK